MDAAPTRHPAEGPATAPPWAVWTGHALAGLCLAYAVVLAIGLWTLPAADQPIQSPWFTAMELLILAIAPTQVVFAAGVHGQAAAGRRPAGLLGLVFMALCAGLTCAVHFTVLTLSRHPALAAAPWADRVLSFTWPSAVYALDILAWDVFFPLGAAALALAVPATGRWRWARGLFVASAVLATLGLAGVPLADMQVRNIGILGYALLFPLGAMCWAQAARRHRSPPKETP